jgi:hypothetical protein
MRFETATIGPQPNQLVRQDEWCDAISAVQLSLSAARRWHRRGDAPEEVERALATAQEAARLAVTIAACDARFDAVASSGWVGTLLAACSNRPQELLFSQRSSQLALAN